MAILLAALTVISTAFGGAVALKSRDKFHLTLGLSAGLLLGLVGFDLWPEVFQNKRMLGNVPMVSVAILFGFLILHFSERLFGSHEPIDSEYGHEHSHSSIAGGLGALAMAGHVFLDGVAIGVAYKVSRNLAIAVFIALLVHAFADGLNTVAMLIKTGHWRERARYLLIIDGLARISGAGFGTYVALSENVVSIYLAVFSGFLIYLATSHILPEAHSKHPSKLTFLATGFGIVMMWIVVAALN